LVKTKLVLATIDMAKCFQQLLLDHIYSSFYVVRQFCDFKHGVYSVLVSIEKPMKGSLKYGFAKIYQIYFEAKLRRFEYIRIGSALASLTLEKLRFKRCYLLLKAYAWNRVVLLVCYIKRLALAWQEKLC